VSDTPRTDAAAADCEFPGPEQEVVDAKFARRLERELREMAQAFVHACDEEGTLFGLGVEIYNKAKALTG
jgi:hypothetical protein